jgi:hypothetical protein
VCVGAAAGSALTGADNTAVGDIALNSATSGDNNTCIGSNAGRLITTGDNNTIVGVASGDALTTGSQNVAVGTDLIFSAVGAVNQIVMGQGVTCVGNSNFTFGDGSNDSNIAFGATTITAPSDIRLKEDIQDQEAGLSFINDLRPVTFRWKKEKDISPELNAYREGSETRTMNDKINHGFIAQEVKAVIDAHDEIKDGFDLWQEDETDGRQRIGASSLETILVKAIQELSTEIDEIKKKLH